jgi:tetratricopeptide (TPR) repeat protein
VSVLPAVVLAERSAREFGVEAQKECDMGRRATERSVRLAHFERSQALAERAIVLDEQLAAAHFALFCSLGEQMRINGETLNPGSLFGFRRMMGALDRTLELDPDHLDAVSSKATFLVRIPALLGGDAAKGEHMLRWVIQRDPKAVNARLALAKSYASPGNRGEAIALASEALKLAQEDRREDLIPEARATLAQLRPTHAGLVTSRP